MAVQLNDAKITVKLDLVDGQKEVESLEKRTVKQRKEAEKDRRAVAKEERKLKSQAKRRPGLAGRIAGAGLFQMIATALRSIPFGAGALIGIGLTKAELVERYGPFIESFVLRLLERQGVPVSDIKLATEAGKEWGEFKSKVASLTTGFEAATQAASADILTGGTVTADEFAELFRIERRFAEFSRNVQLAQRRFRQQVLGPGVADSLFVDELNKATSLSLNK